MVLKTFELGSAPPVIKAEPLTPEAFAPFGGVISPDHQAAGHRSQANYGTAIKILRVAPITNKFSESSQPETATANWNIFRCTPPDHLIQYGESKRGNLYNCKVLERHPYSTQAFVPMGRDRREIGYLVIVVRDDKDRLPDLSTVKAFICYGNQSVTYGVGTWHAPMIALNDVIDFGVLIHENGVDDDNCQECYVNPGLQIQFDL